MAPLIFPVQEVSISSSRQRGGQNICEMATFFKYNCSFNGNKLENTKCLGLRLLEEVLTSWTGKVSGATVISYYGRFQCVRNIIKNGGNNNWSE